MGKFEQPRKRKTGETRAASAQRRHSGKKNNHTKTVLIAAAAVVAALVIGVVGYAMAVSKGGDIFPNVYVAGVNVGGMSKEEAVQAVQAAVDQTYGISTLAVKLPDRTLSFEPQDVKVSLDVESAVDQAWKYGRSHGIFKALFSRKSADTTEQFINIEDSLSLDEDFIRGRIEEVADEVASERKDSTYEIEETEVPATEEGQAPTKIPTQLTIQVGTSQRSLDADGLYDAVIAAFMNNDFSPLEFAYDETPYTPVDLDSLYDELCTDMKDAYYDAEKKVIVEEVEGYGFDLAAAKQQQAMAAEGSTMILELSEVDPAITKATLEEKLFHDVLAKYDSKHVYNPSRTNNLDLACKAINGTILNPGDIFSFNDTVGERTSAKGYQAAIVYVSGDSKPELGGGVCQVASTIYVCTLLADLNVTERAEHMFAVTYVPMGADATIYWGSLDFKFENNTSYPLRIDASVSDGYVHIALVGTKETDETIELIPVTTSTTQWKDVEKVDETKPADYKEVTVTPYVGYRVTLYIQRYDANGNPKGEKELAQHPYSNYRVRDRVTTIGKQPEKPVDPQPPTDPQQPTLPVDPVTPVEPVDPVDPTPTEPVDPTPTEPVDPDPVDPTEPTEPTDPDSPYDPFTSGNDLENLG